MKLKTITYTAIGVALYVVLSMAVKIPLFTGHLALDLGYVVLAVYALQFGAIPAAIVGGAGCAIVSMLTSGMFPFGWILGNIFIGLTVGFVATRNRTAAIFVSIPAVFLGVAVIKTAVECAMFAIPVVVKFPKNVVAFVADAIVMVFGCGLTSVLQKRFPK